MSVNDNVIRFGLFPNSLIVLDVEEEVVVSMEDLLRVAESCNYPI